MATSVAQYAENDFFATSSPKTVTLSWSAGDTIVIAGGAGTSHDAPRRLVERLGTVTRAIFTGYITREALRALYGSALAFVFPSLSEGFGLPVLEAMQCGAPVITSHLTSLPEVAGDAAIQVEPRLPSQIARAMQALVDNPHLREDLMRRGMRRARQFSWVRFAETFVQLAAALHGKSQVRTHPLTTRRAA